MVEVLALLANLEVPAHLDRQAHEERAPKARNVVRQRQVRLTPEGVDELVLAYQQGATVRELVEQFGIHRTTVLGHLDRRGVARRVNVRKMTDGQVLEAARYYRAGNSLMTTGRHFGVDAATIAREFRKASVATRPPTCRAKP